MGPRALLPSIQLLTSMQIDLRPVLLAGLALMILPACGTTSCQELVTQYANEEENAQACDPTVPNSCTVQLPIPFGIPEGGNTLWEGLASDCNSAFNPAHSAHLQAIYSQFLAQGCKAEAIPACGAGPVGHCNPAPAGYPSLTGYICED